MPVFDQRGQHVIYQYNAEGDINFGAVQNRLDVVGELEKLQTEMSKAIEAGVLEGQTAIDAKYQLDNAVYQAKEAEPDKKTVLDHLSEAKALIEGVTTATGLVTALVQAAEVVRNFL